MASRGITRVLAPGKPSALSKGSRRVSVRGFANSSVAFAKTPQPEDAVHEVELNKKLGWVIKILAAGTITYVAYNAYPLMGDSMMWQTVALVRSQDPFMQRSGASRMCWIATNDEKRRNFVKEGGIVALSKMLEIAPDDKTRREALKALMNLCQCDAGIEALRLVGNDSLFKVLASESTDDDIVNQSKALLEKLRNHKCGLEKKAVA